MRQAQRIAAVLALGVLFALPVTADWLVTRDGSDFEIEGSWEEKGRLVVFTLKDGTLSSMRASELDLEASRALTQAKIEEAAKEAETLEVAPQDREPILVLTDDDVGHVDPEDLVSPEEDGEGEGGSGSQQPELQVTNWRQSNLDDGGLRIRGTVRNNSDRPAVGITILINLLDVQGNLVASKPGVLTARSLGASELANFQADFPEVILFESATFEVKSRDFNVSAEGDAVQSAPEAEPAFQDNGGSR